jgi:hypothetical protein
VDLLAKDLGQKRLAFALVIGGGVYRVMLFNSVSVEILNDNALLGVLGLRGGSASEAPFDEIRPLIYIF